MKMMLWTDDNCGKIHTMQDGEVWNSMYMAHGKHNYIHLFGETEDEAYCAMAERLMGLFENGAPQTLGQTVNDDDDDGG